MLSHPLMSPTSSSSHRVQVVHIQHSGKEAGHRLDQRRLGALQLHLLKTGLTWAATKANGESERLNSVCQPQLMHQRCSSRATQQLFLGRGVLRKAQASAFALQPQQARQPCSPCLPTCHGVPVLLRPLLVCQQRPGLLARLSHVRQRELHKAVRLPQPASNQASSQQLQCRGIHSVRLQQPCCCCCRDQLQVPLKCSAAAGCGRSKGSSAKPLPWPHSPCCRHWGCAR